jgi:hypothetical protein
MGAHAQLVRALGTVEQAHHLAGERGKVEGVHQ